MKTIGVLCMLFYLFAIIGAVPTKCKTSRDCPRNMTCPGVMPNRQCVNSTCATVTVLETPVDNHGGVGGFFNFSAEEFSKMVGYEDWDMQVFEIVQSGSNSWEGEVAVSKHKNTSHGFKNDWVIMTGDWKVSDTISLKSCSNPDHHPCRDVTFGKCDPNDFANSIVLSKKSQHTLQLCNADCYVTDNCMNYRYDNLTQECILLSREYRGKCDIIAGPVDAKMSDCIGTNDEQRCDFHMEEDCEYNGALLYRYPGGRITSPAACQRMCKTRAPDCKYWIYRFFEFLCILKRDGNRTCNVWVGPKQPSYDQCKNLPMSRQALGF